MWKKLQNPEHPEQKTSTCTGTDQAVPVHLVQKMGSGQPVPVQVEPVPVHPSNEQPIPIQVKAVPVQVVPTALF